MNGIIVENITTETKDNFCLSGISLQVTDYKRLAVIGPSGGGKSTLLRVCLGLEDLVSGQVLVNGEKLAPANLIAVRRRIGYAVQGATLFPHFTVLRNVSLVAALEGWPPDQIQKRALDLFSVLNLEPALLERYPHQLSGGQAQRAALARAFFMHPKIMLLDEAFSALDPVTKGEIYGYFELLAEKFPVNLVMVTHDLAEAKRLTGSGIFVAGGKALQSGTWHELTSNPASQVVADFFGGQV